MNYKEMLDQFEFLDKKLAHLELENRYLKERVAKLEGNWWFNQPKPPSYTPHTPAWPNTVWYSTTETINPQDTFQ